MELAPSWSQCAPCSIPQKGQYLAVWEPLPKKENMNLISTTYGKQSNQHDNNEIPEIFVISIWHNYEQKTFPITIYTADNSRTLRIFKTREQVDHRQTVQNIWLYIWNSKPNISIKVCIHIPQRENLQSQYWVLPRPKFPSNRQSPRLRLHDLNYYLKNVTSILKTAERLNPQPLKTPK